MRPSAARLSGPSLRRFIEQAAIAAAIAGAIYALASLTAASLRARGVSTGFAFLSKPANFGISESLVPFTPGISTYARVVLAGLCNTLFVSALAVVLSTVIGVAVGLSRLSPNWLLSRSAGWFIETVRNVPLPLHLLLWYQILLNLPPPRRAIVWFDAVVLSNRGLWIPTIVWHEVYGVAAAGLGCLVAVLAAHRRISGRSGERSRVPLGIAGVVAVTAVAAALAAFGPAAIDVPVLRGFNYQGGAALSPELTALVVGLSLYAAAFVAEIVRAGVLAVPTGQREAGRALGLTNGRILQKIVMPQSLRLTIPPLASEYLSTIKNSSLAVVIGYPELTSLVNTMLSDTGQPIEAIAILMLAYLTISFSVSFFMRWYEARTAVPAR